MKRVLKMCHMKIIKMALSSNRCQVFKDPAVKGFMGF